MGSAQSFLSFLISFVVFFIALPSLMAVLSLFIDPFFSAPYRPRFGVLTGKLIGLVQYFLSVFTFLAFSFMVASPLSVLVDPEIIIGTSAGDSSGGLPRPVRLRGMGVRHALFPAPALGA